MKKILFLLLSGAFLFFSTGCGNLFSGSKKSDKNEKLALLALLSSASVNIVGNWQWTQIHGETVAEYGTSCTVDSKGNIYIAGFTSSALDGQSYGGGTDVLLMKYASNGNRQWTRLRGGTGNEVAYGVAVDTNDNVYLTGETSASFDGQILTAGALEGTFLIKYDSDGNYKWTIIKDAGNGTTTLGTGVAVDTDGYVYIAGYVSATLDSQTFGGGTKDAFIIKYNSNGIWQWTHLAGSTGAEYSTGIGIDSSDNIYISGFTDDSFDGQTYSGGSGDTFVIKYDPNGTRQWTRLRGGPIHTYSQGSQFPITAAVEKNGNVYITGTTDGPFDGQTFSGGTGDTFIIKYDSNGTWQWTRLKGTSSVKSTYGFGITMDTVGNVYITGTTEGSLDGQTFSGGTRDAFIIKYNSNGTWQWTRQKGGGSSTLAYGICISGSNLYIAGFTSAAFDGQSYGGGAYDAFVIKYQ